jgi:hypothetical protein
MHAESILLGFLLVPLALAAGFIVWALYGLATWVWGKLHIALIQKIVVRSSSPYDDNRQERIDRMVKDIARAPHFHTFAGLGWMVVFVRDFKEKK